MWSMMNAMIRIPPPQAGHTSGSISLARLISRTQVRRGGRVSAPHLARPGVGAPVPAREIRRRPRLVGFVGACPARRSRTPAVADEVTARLGDVHDDAGETLVRIEFNTWVLRGPAGKSGVRPLRPRSNSASYG